MATPRRKCSHYVRVREGLMGRLGFRVVVRVRFSISVEVSVVDRK